MNDPVIALFAPLTKKELEKSLTRILDQIRSLSDWAKVEEAVETNRTLFAENLLTFAMSLEPEFKKRTSRSFDESTDEEIGRYHRLLAGALFEIFDEINPERIKMLAAATVGGTWGDVEGQLRSVAWNAIKRLEPASVFALHELQNSDVLHDKYVKIITVSDQALTEDNRHTWLAMLEGTGCIRTFPALSCPDTTVKKQLTYDSSRMFYIPQTTDIGKAVLEMLKGFLPTT